MRRVLEHTIDIHATPEQVWEALTGFDAYDGWNPFMRRVAGAPEVGSRLRIELSPPDGRRTSKPITAWPFASKLVFTAAYTVPSWATAI